MAKKEVQELIKIQKSFISKKARFENEDDDVIIEDHNNENDDMDAYEIDGEGMSD